MLGGREIALGFAGRWVRDLTQVEQGLRAEPEDERREAHGLLGLFEMRWPGLLAQGSAEGRPGRTSRRELAAEPPGGLPSDSGAGAPVVSSVSSPDFDSPSSEKRRRSVTRKPRGDSFSSLMIGYPVASTRWTACGVNARRLVGSRARGTAHPRQRVTRTERLPLMLATLLRRAPATWLTLLMGRTLDPGQVLVKDSHAHQGRQHALHGGVGCIGVRGAPDRVHT